MTHPFLHESFAEPVLASGLAWMNEPARWTIRAVDACLRIEPDSGSGFCGKAHDGVESDSGHLLFVEVADDFMLATRVAFHGQHPSDQAGLMVRVSRSCWLTASVEQGSDGLHRLGVVVTNHGDSDWSAHPLPARARNTWLRIRREGREYVVDVSRDGATWHLIRAAQLHEDMEGTEVRAGLYACSPQAAGLAAEFSFLTLAPRTLRH